jgi:hypothetical protein
MGLHTWFYRDKNIYKESKDLQNKLDQFDNYEIYLDDMEVLQLNHRLDELDKLNDSNFHDCFRTTKREENGEYTYDVIYSKSDCDKWLKDNKNTIYSMNEKRLNDFWNKFPDGCIDFG